MSFPTGREDMVNKLSQLTVIGAGAWGSALASIFQNKFDKTIIWSYLQEEANQINTLKENKTYLPGVSLNTVQSTTSIEEAIKDADLLISAVPSFAIRTTWEKVVHNHKKNVMFINASKGIEKDVHKLPHEIFKELFADSVPYFSICGPSFATDVAKGSPTAVNLASTEKEIAIELMSRLQSETFFLHYSDDVIGTELGAVLKNVVAIASGMMLGMGLGFNTQALIVVQGMKEMRALGSAMSAKEETFLGMAGLGDLLLTAMNAESRNMTFGYELGKGIDIDEALEKLKGISEGYYTTYSLDYLLQKYNLKLPLFTMMIDIIVNKKNPRACLASLFKQLF